MSIGFVTLVQGEVLARDPRGNTRRLKEGDQINKGDTVITPAGGRVEIMTDNGPIALGEQQTVAMTDEVAGTVDPTDASVAPQTIAQLNTIVGPNGELINLDELDATAAGGGAGGGGEGNSFVMLLRIAESVTPLQYEFGINTFDVPDEIEGVSAPISLTGDDVIVIPPVDPEDPPVDPKEPTVVVTKEYRTETTVDTKVETVVGDEFETNRTTTSSVTAENKDGGVLTTTTTTTVVTYDRATNTITTTTTTTTTYVRDVTTTTASDGTVTVVTGDWTVDNVETAVKTDTVVTNTPREEQIVDTQTEFVANPPPPPPDDEEKGLWQIDQTKAAGDEYSTFEVAEGDSAKFNVTLGGAGNAKLNNGDSETIRVAVVGGVAVLGEDFELSVEGQPGLTAEIIETGADYIIVKMTATQDGVNLTGAGFTVTVTTTDDSDVETLEHLKLEIQDPSYGGIRQDKDDIGYDIVDNDDDAPPPVDPEPEDDEDDDNPPPPTDPEDPPEEEDPKDPEEEEDPPSDPDDEDEPNDPPVDPKPEDDKGGSKGNNGWGNGDQDAPGNSGPNNNAENSDRENPLDKDKGKPERDKGGPQGNNGFGNGDDDAPGNSLDNNNAENAGGEDAAPEDYPGNSNKLKFEDLLDDSPAQGGNGRSGGMSEFIDLPDVRVDLNIKPVDF